MRELDRIAIDEFGLTLERMMENAGRHFAELARRSLGGHVAARRVVVLAGPGGNGGGGLVAARHLANAGAYVSVVLTRPPDQLAAVTQAQYRILAAMGLAATSTPPDGDVDLVLDAVLGYSQAGALAGLAAELVEWARLRRVISLDVPSGLEFVSGLLWEPHVEAEATLMLAAPKEALRRQSARETVGALFLADVSVPTAAYERLGIAWTSPFAASPLVRTTSYDETT
jgi:NAD(P)H-hydrate epimerase